MTAKSIFLKEFNFYQRFQSYGGFDVFSKDWAFNWRSAVTLINCAVWISTVINAVNRVWGDLVLTIFSIANVGYGVLGIHRYIVWPLHKDIIDDLFDHYESILDEWDPKSQEGKEVLENVQGLKKSVKRVWNYLVLVSIGGNVPPVLSYILTGETVLPFQYFLPFVDDTQTPGYQVNLVFQWIQTYVSISVILANLFLIFFVAALIKVQCGILKIQFSRLNDILVRTPEDLTNQNKLLRKIFSLHQSLDECIDNIEEVLSQQTFVDIFMLSSTVTMVFFIMTLQFYPPGVFVVGLNTFMLFVVCYIGTFTEKNLEELYETIGQTHWYHLTVAKQKLFSLLVLKSQSTERLTAGGIRPLNLELFVTV